MLFEYPASLILAALEAKKIYPTFGSALTFAPRAQRQSLTWAKFLEKIAIMAARGHYLRLNRRLLWRLLLWAVLLFALFEIWRGLAETGMRYEWQWNRIWRHFGRLTPNGFVPGPLCEGIAMTIGITALGAVLACVFGLAAAVLRLSPWPFCQSLARIYVNLWRNTPLLLQLFFAYFLVSPLLDTGPFWTAILCLAAFEGAYVAEVLRAALLSVPKGQWEAALSLGFGLPQALLQVILPQALANACGPLTNQAIALLKDTSLVSAIAVADLTMRSQAIVAETFLAFEVWLLAGAIYLFLALCLALPGILLEKRARARLAPR